MTIANNRVCYVFLWRGFSNTNSIQRLTKTRPSWHASRKGEDIADLRQGRRARGFHPAGAVESGVLRSFRRMPPSRESDIGVPGGAFGFDSRSSPYWIAQSGRATVSSTVCRGFDSRSKTVLPRQWFIAVTVGCGMRKHPSPARPGASVRSCGRASGVGWQGRVAWASCPGPLPAPLSAPSAPPQEPTEAPAGPAQAGKL